MAWNPEYDGKTHINAYSRGKTEIGRLLSNFAQTPFTCEDGAFASVEAYWYWLRAPEHVRDRLRPLWGFEAKRVGRSLGGFDWPKGAEFRRKIEDALVHKALATIRIQALLPETGALPIVHYYWKPSRFHNGAPEVTEVTGGLWVWDRWAEIRSILWGEKSS